MVIWPLSMFDNIYIHLGLHAGAMRRQMYFYYLDKIRRYFE